MVHLQAVTGPETLPTLSNSHTVLTFLLMPRQVVNLQRLEPSSGFKFFKAIQPLAVKLCPVIGSVSLHSLCEEMTVCLPGA